MAPPSERSPAAIGPEALPAATKAVDDAVQSGDLLRLTASLVDIPSESRHEHAIADVIEAILRRHAPELQVDRVGCNVVARTELGRSHRVVIAGHTDTVPIAGNVPGVVDGDVVRGCGASDMKSGLAVMLAVAIAVPVPALDVTWVFYEAEEIASEFNGLGRLFRERPQLVTGDVALLGEPTAGAIEAGCQGTLRLRVVLRGARAHTARPWMGRNAIHRAADLLTRLESYEARRPVLDGCEFRESLQAVRIEGGVAGNVVPDEVILVVNHRFAPDRSLEEAEAHVRAVLGPVLEAGDTFELVDAANAAAPSLEHPVIVALIERNQLPVRAKLGWTDVARFAAHGVPAVNFGPGDATLAHRADEWVDRAPLQRTYAALADLLQARPRSMGRI